MATLQWHVRMSQRETRESCYYDMTPPELENRLAWKRRLEQLLIERAFLRVEGRFVSEARARCGAIHARR